MFCPNYHERRRGVPPWVPTLDSRRCRRRRTVRSHYTAGSRTAVAAAAAVVENCNTAEVGHRTTFRRRGLGRTGDHVRTDRAETPAFAVGFREFVERVVVVGIYQFLVDAVEDLVAAADEALVADVEALVAAEALAEAVEAHPAAAPKRLAAADPAVDNPATPVAFQGRPATRRALAVVVVVVAACIPSQAAAVAAVVAVEFVVAVAAVEA
jgi:hypothetical protein